MTGTTYDGAVTLEVQGTRWRRTRRPPLELTVLERAEGLLALPTDQSGGTRGGDRLRTEVVVRQEARVDWLPPASALYFPSADRTGVCHVENHLEVGNGSRLWYRPKASIPCAQARVDQVVALDVGSGSDFLYWDTWMDGRTASGERGQFARLSNQLELRVDGRCCYHERWTLEGPGREGTRNPEGTPDPAGFQGACQWSLGLAVGETARASLLEAVAWWCAQGQCAETGQLDDNVWLARVLSTSPRG